MVSSPAFAGVAFTAVSADASNDVWAVGEADTFNGASFNGPAVLHFNGTSWSLAALPSTGNVNAVTALSPTNVWAVGDIPSGSAKHPGKPQVDHWNGTSWTIVASPDVSAGVLEGIAAISANDIWAVGIIAFSSQTLTENWDGTSWSVISSPDPAQNQNELFGVTALSDGTVAAVGRQVGSNGDQPLILQNAASAPGAAAPAAVLTTTAAPNEQTPAPSGLTPAPLNAALVDQFFATPAKADQPLSLVGSGSEAVPEAANSGDLDVLTDATSLWPTDWKSGLA